MCCSEIQALSGKINLLIDKLGDLDDEVRGPRPLPPALNHGQVD
jgi:hypothetical protein